MKIYYVDGRFVPSEKAALPVDDLAILRGFGVCDIMRTFNGQPYLINEHVERLEKSANGIGLSLPWSKRELIDIIYETLKKNELRSEVNIRIVITGGSSPDYMYPKGAPRLVILVTDMAPLPDAWYSHGVKVITTRQERDLPDTKVTSYISATLALKEAKKQDAVEVIYVNRKNQVLEGATSNLFAVFENRLVTPKTGVLKGITRQAVLSLSNQFCTVRETPIQLKDLLAAEEVFITGTNKAVVPVVRVDNTRIGNGIPGQLTRRIMKALEDHSQEFIQKR